MTRLRWLAIVLLLALARSGPAVAVELADGETVAGKLLVAAESMPDPRFRGTVIYICRHAKDDGALGLVLNRRIGVVPAATIAEEFGLDAHPSGDSVALHWGGPVELGRGFVLHTNDYASESTTAVDSDISFSVDTQILADIVEGRGPKRRILVMGYAGWAAGQLESELRRDDWLVVPADQSIVFEDDVAHMWQDAVDRLGIDL
jgi:putative transcriptional regulator